MAQTKIVGPMGNEMEVDKTFLAGRIAMRPLEYASKGRVLGHYATAQRSGELAATIGALGHLASIRWANDNAFCVLMRIKAGYSVSAAITAAVEMNIRAIIVRGFTVDFTTAATACNMAAISDTNKMRKTMGTSLMGTAGPRISTTAVQSGQTLTADANPFAMAVWDNNNIITGTVTQPVGIGFPTQTLYECTSPYQHPVVLSQYEGVVLQPITAGPGTGTYALYTQWEWSEVEVF